MAEFLTKTDNKSTLMVRTACDSQLSFSRVHFFWAICDACLIILRAMDRGHSEGGGSEASFSRYSFVFPAALLILAQDSGHAGHFAVNVDVDN